jgi:hypothetical protein
MNLRGVPSSQVKWDPTAEDIFDGATQRLPGDPPAPVIPAGMPIREFMAKARRETIRKFWGAKADIYEETELVDVLYYTVFPNFHPWGGFNELVYRFRPNGNDNRTAIMEALYLSPFQGDRPPPAPIHHLTLQQEFVDAPELGTLARVFDQDLYNMPRMQTGMEASKKGALTLSSYQEGKIRHFYRLHSQWLGFNS